MNIYVVNIIVTAILAGLFILYKPSAKKKKVFCGIATLNWILISGLRDMSVGADTLSYQKRFNGVLTTSWKDIFNKFYFVYVNDEGKDPGYDVFEKIVQLFTNNYQVYLVIVAIVFFVFMAIWIYKNSPEPFMSYLIFASFLFGFYAITGIRQTLATVLVVFIGTKFIKERKLWKFLLLILVAFTIHKSSICFLPFYFLSRWKIDWKHIAVVVCSMPFLFIFNKQFMQILGYLVGYDYTELENRGAYGFTILYFAVAFVMIILFKQIKATCPEYTLYYNALFMGLVFLPLVFVNPTTMRVVQYFSIFLMLSIPAIIHSFKPKLQPIVYFVIAGALMFATNVYDYEYLFFWQ